MIGLSVVELQPLCTLYCLLCSISTPSGKTYAWMSLPSQHHLMVWQTDFVKLRNSVYSVLIKQLAISSVNLCPRPIREGGDNLRSAECKVARLEGNTVSSFFKHCSVTYFFMHCIAMYNCHVHLHWGFDLEAGGSETNVYFTPSP